MMKDEVVRDYDIHGQERGKGEMTMKCNEFKVS